jgi:hypothetical protein
MIDKADPDQIARNFFAEWQLVDVGTEDAPFLTAPRDDPNFRRHAEAAERIDEIVQKDPSAGWDLILALVDRAPNDKT